MSDYEQWLAKVRAAVEGRNKRAVARWLAERMGHPFPTVQVRLQKMLARNVMPTAEFAVTVNAWMEAGHPEVHLTRPPQAGRAGGQARAVRLSPERRREIAARANEAKQAKRAK